MRLLLLILGILTISISLCSQPSSKKMISGLEKARIDWGVPGMSVGIVHQGEVFLNRGFGFKEQGKSEPTNATTQYAIASNTKAFVSAAIGTLVMDGKLKWDEPVRKYLPDFAMYDPYVTEHITVRDLLCHRAGLGTFSGDVIWYKSEKSAAEVIKQIKYVPQAYPFRSGYGYSNLMFITAGEVIKAVSGLSWEEYVRKTFFEPLQMNETITSTNNLSSNVATPHKPTRNINQPIPWVNWDNMGAAGGIISSSDDMLNWIQLLLNKGISEGDTLIDPDILNEMWTPHNAFPITEKSKLDLPGRNFNGYGLGWGLYDYFGRKVVTHSGGYDGMYSRVVLVPDEQLGFVVLTNSMTGIITPVIFDIINQFIKEDTRDWHEKYLQRPGGEGMSDWIDQRKTARIENTSPRKENAHYTGTYYDPFYGTITIKEQEGKLRLLFEQAPDLSATLAHWQLDTWEIKWDHIHAWFDFGLINFTFNTENEVIGIEFDVPNYDIFFDEIHAKKR